MLIKGKLQAEKLHTGGGLRPGTGIVGRFQKLHTCCTLHFRGQMKTFGQLGNPESLLVGKWPCEKQTLMLTSVWFVLTNSAKLGRPSAKRGGTKPRGMFTVSACFEWGIIWKFLIKQSACAISKPSVHPTDTLCVSWHIINAVSDPGCSGRRGSQGFCFTFGLPGPALSYPTFARFSQSWPPTQELLYL